MILIDKQPLSFYLTKQVKILIYSSIQAVWASVGLKNVEEQTQALDFAVKGFTEELQASANTDLFSFNEAEFDVLYELLKS